MRKSAGEDRKPHLRVLFDRRVKLEFRGSRVTPDAGPLAFRELEEALGLTEMADDFLVDPRTSRNGRHSLTAQLRQAIFGRLAGYEDTNDAERLGLDPAMRWIIGGSAVTDRAACTSQMGRSEIGTMTEGHDLAALANLSGNWIDRARSGRGAAKTLILDMDSSVSPSFGEQEGSADNGHTDGRRSSGRFPLPALRALRHRRR